MPTKTTPKSKLSQWFRMCTRRHICLLAALALIGAFYVLRQSPPVAEWLAQYIARPYQRLSGRITGVLQFSLTELLYVILIIGVLVYIIRSAYLITRSDKKLKRIYVSVISLATSAALIIAGVCYLWNVCYYAEGFEQKSGIYAQGATVEELYEVTMMFASLANEYSTQVLRDENEVFNEAEKEIFSKAKGIYSSLCEEFDFLEAPEISAKPMLFSYFMSYINFSGFFFCFTGEANVNVDAPQFLLPVTIAHEMAHQRGIAAEQEANFVAVAACLADGDPVFVYSAAMLAYTYLSNALLKEDSELFSEVYITLNEAVKNDLKYNSEYWSQFETKVASASEAVYSSYLQGQGQVLGIKSYGACVDLLIAYYNIERR